MKTIEQIEAQMVELQKELELLKNPPSYKRWRAEKGGIYYTINNEGLVVPGREYYDKIDAHNYNIGNYYKTEKEAEDAYNMQTAIVRVNDKINELNEGWEHNNKLDRYYILFENNKYFVDYYDYGHISPRILNYCKTKEIAERIIEECKDDLYLIFNLK